MDEKIHTGLFGAEVASALPTSPLMLQKSFSPAIVSPSPGIKRPHVVSPVTAGLKAPTPSTATWAANNARINQGSMYGFDSAYGNADGATDLWGSSAHANITAPPPAVHYSPRHPAGVSVETPWDDGGHDHSHGASGGPAGAQAVNSELRSDNASAPTAIAQRRPDGGHAELIP
mgnify:CR=1 FL=1